MIKFNIYGSCVSRDIFEYDEMKDMKLLQYVARQSVLSCMSEPVSVSDEQIELDSPFQKRMVLMDLRKNTFDIFEENPGDYLLIDLIDERLPLGKLGNSYFTVSNEMAQGFNAKKYKTLSKRVYGNKLCLEYQSTIRFPFSIKFLNRFCAKKDNMDCEEMIRMFCKRILSLYDQNQIILNRALLVDWYINEYGNVKLFPKNYLKFNSEANTVLSFMYDRLVSYMPNIHIVDEMEGVYADERHKWGLAPMHYQGDYYLRVIDRLKTIICKEV